MSILPGNRIPEIIKRMDINSSQAEAMKTCFGILAIMSREESNKVLIAKDGMEVLLNAMTVHIDRTDVQEAGCDLLWSLAFNSSAVKEIIAKFNGAVILVRALKRHSRSPDFLKSACGALSNICQYRQNQEAVAYQGGLQPLVGSIHIHQTNSKLLPFVFDAIASIIVNNEENARSVSSLGIIPVVVASLSRHKLSREVVKSGCHTLAILSDVKGQASKIAFAGGVPIILSLLDIHPLYSDLHRVAAVVLLRMLQESSHVGREICCHDGVRILLFSLEKGGAQQDTVAAVTHILYTVTNPSSISATSIESQLWYKNDPSADATVADSAAKDPHPKTALCGVVNVLRQYSGRRDVVRAACRLISNLSGFEQVIVALDHLFILDHILECASVHKDAKDVIETTALLLRLIFKKKVPSLQSCTDAIRRGLLHIIKSKNSDEELISIILEMLTSRFEEYDQSTDSTSSDSSVLENWYHPLAICLMSILEKNILLREGKNDNCNGNGNKSESGVCFSSKSLMKVLRLLEKMRHAGKISGLENQLNNLKCLLRSLKHSPEVAGLEDLLPMFDDFHKVEYIDDTHINKHTEVLANTESANDQILRKNPSYLDVPRESSNETRVDVKCVEKLDVFDQNSQVLQNTDKTSKLLPRHPTMINANGNKGNKLLENWPNYLERLLATSGSRNVQSFHEGSSYPRMHICYESGKPGGKNIISKCPIVMPYNVPAEGVGLRYEHSLTFDSEFESGNLYRAIQVADASYDLLLRPDIHSLGHTQWFYFAVSNTHPVELVRLSEQGVVVPSVRVNFNIVNFTKPDSLFNLGMRPVVYSTHDAKTKNIGWVRAGTDISYYANSYSRGNTAGEGSSCHYTLSFTLEFQHPKDTVLIAYCYPYTISDYKTHINETMRKPGIENIFRRYKLCTTLAGEDCELLVITDFNDKDRIGPIAPPDSDIEETTYLNQLKPTKGKDGRTKSGGFKPALFLSARVHPGETPASWMMKGMLDFLCSDSSPAKLLRQMFVIFVIPMLNPDGVMFGNNRCSLAGVDLNRQWKLPSKALHPTIYFLKLFMVGQRKLRDISMYIDLHGHSRKYNVFMYGCDEKKKPKPQVRVFPKMLSSHSIGSKYVCYEDCSFHIKKGRESTARVVVARELNIPCSFTLEATFCGSNYGPLKNCHMNIGHLQEVGAAVCDAFLHYSVSEGYAKDLVSVVGPMTASDSFSVKSDRIQQPPPMKKNTADNDNAGPLEGKRQPKTAENEREQVESDSDDDQEDTNTIEGMECDVDIVQIEQNAKENIVVKPLNLERKMEMQNHLTQKLQFPMSISKDNSEGGEIMESLSVRSYKEKADAIKSNINQSEKIGMKPPRNKQDDEISKVSLSFDEKLPDSNSTRRRDKAKLKAAYKNGNIQQVSRSAGGSKTMELSGIGVRRLTGCIDDPISNDSTASGIGSKTMRIDTNEIKGSGSTIVKGEFSDLFFGNKDQNNVDLVKGVAVATTFGLPKVSK